MSELISRLRQRGVAHVRQVATIDARGLSVSYKTGSIGPNNGRTDPLALEDVTFRVEAGEYVAVVGPNGAGKSTLFRLLVGAMKPGRGELSIYGSGPAGHICIGYVPQRSQMDLSFPVTVEDVVMMGRVGQIGLFRWPRRRDWELARAALARVRADHLAQKHIGELSGGQQQRVFIARALAQEAELLLLDEPLTGLDLPSQNVLFEVLEELRPDGVTIMVATHDLTLAAERFDRVMLLNRRLVAMGPAAEALAADNLLQAYGGHLHRLGDEGALLLAEPCCDDEDH